MDTFDKAVGILLVLTPTFVLAVCLVLCVRRRDFLGGPGALGASVLVLGICHFVTERCVSPYRYLLIGLVGGCYLWLFAVRPFRRGLRGEK